ncbi:MAG: 7-cyano-7-deazaguanine/7-aminomethyl-7-deazaguanine transporter [Endozoicomonas sp. (ex Botrylloides leachii)]|nr:7-cyano-7-deazaguanine/7-aminomethyl-7-deazaguanine transporter [Endozoicomonas sp. (ex Botrylloides leachii)]
MTLLVTKNKPTPTRLVYDYRTYTLGFLVLFHIIVITLSNYLVQIPVAIFNFHATWGTFSFPIVYVASDLTVRIYGASTARRIIATVMFPALLISYTVSVIFNGGHFQGIKALTTINVETIRISIASFAAYCSGQILDITLFNKLRRMKVWWIAPVVSSIIGNALDTFIFFSTAFYKSADMFMSTHWVNIALADYSFKIIVCLCFAVPLYGSVLKILQRNIIFQKPVYSVPLCAKKW